MLSFIPFVVLANLAFSSAAAIPQKRGLVSDVLSALGALTGTNAASSSAGCQAWFGKDGDYTSEFINNSGEDIELVLWGSWASWVNVNKPLINHSLKNGSSVHVSYASGISGGFAAVYSDTKLVNGQVSETWGEFTFDGMYSTFDVSREVNMNGHDMSMETDGCTSDMDTCVFKCLEGTTCMTGYELSNCATGSQDGASYGVYAGAPSGGCLVGSNNHVKTTFT